MSKSNIIDKFQNKTEIIEEILSEDDDRIIFSATVSGEDTRKKLEYESVEKNLVIKKEHLQHLDYEKIKEILLLFKENKKLLELKGETKMDRLEKFLNERNVKYEINHWTNKED